MIDSSYKFGIDRRSEFMKKQSNICQQVFKFQSDTLMGDGSTTGTSVVISNQYL